MHSEILHNITIYHKSKLYQAAGKGSEIGASSDEKSLVKIVKVAEVSGDCHHS